MFHIGAKYCEDTFYDDLAKELELVMAQERNTIAKLSNLSAWLYHAIPDLNWCGFYLWVEQDGELVVGPFQGLPACVRIKSGRGVCGTSFAQRASLKVDDVESFPGHIACDSASKSELVIPLIHAKSSYCHGVLDLDSPLMGRFSTSDQIGLEELIRRLVPIVF